jgi:hypothetical protein
VGKLFSPYTELTVAEPAISTPSEVVPEGEEEEEISLEDSRILPKSFVHISKLNSAGFDCLYPDVRTYISSAPLSDSEMLKPRLRNASRSNFVVFELFSRLRKIVFDSTALGGAEKICIPLFTRTPSTITRPSSVTISAPLGGGMPGFEELVAHDTQNREIRMV